MHESKLGRRIFGYPRHPLRVSSRCGLLGPGPSRMRLAGPLDRACARWITHLAGPRMRLLDYAPCLLDHALTRTAGSRALRWTVRALAGQRTRALLRCCPMRASPLLGPRCLSACCPRCPLACAAPSRSTGIMRKVVNRWRLHWGIVRLVLSD